VAEALKVLIADEDPDSRVNARKAVQRAQLGIAGESGYGTEAVTLAIQTLPDVILVAVEEPSARPLETAEALANAMADTPIIVYSSQEDAAAIRRAMIFGARDFLLKPLQAAPLKKAILHALEQEEKRQMRRAGQLASSHARGTVITIAGAKGGIGKTVVCVNLALALREQSGKNVVILDADTQFGDVATMLDLKPSATSRDALRHLDRIDRTNVRDFVTTHSSGVDVLAADHEDESWAVSSPGAVKRIIDALAEVYDFVVVDTAGSLDAFTRACIESSTLTLLVTSGEVSAVRDTAASLRRLASWEVDPDRIRIVLNRGAGSVGARVRDVAEALQHDIYWDLPYDKSVPLAVQLGQPVVGSASRSPVADGLTELARRISGGRNVLAPEPPRRPAWWRRPLQLRGRQQRDAALATVPQPSDGQR
jgi:pilus assembly protein CpaE